MRSHRTGRRTSVLTCWRENSSLGWPVSDPVCRADCRSELSLIGRCLILKMKR